MRISEARVAADSRIITQQEELVIATAIGRSAGWHYLWTINLGWSAAEPQEPGVEISKARVAADSRIITQEDLVIAPAVGRSADWHYRWTINLGFRCAPPQALCCRPLRGLRAFALITKLLIPSMRAGATGSVGSL